MLRWPAVRPLALLALALLGAGATTFAYAASLGQATVVLLLVVPIIVGTGPWGVLAGLLVMAGLLAGFAAWASSGLRGAPAPTPWEGDEASQPAAPPAGERRTHSGGFLLLGPIPIAFGTTKGLALTMLLLALAALALLLLLPMLLRGIP
jgi:uncharacterized protein (TIGR00304 family)